MTNHRPHPTASTPAEPLQPLTDRVRDRVAEAGFALERRASASRPKAKRPARSATRASQPLGSPEAVRESRSLRRVFSDMGDTYHQYRQRTGQPVLPALRDAAYAFKREPSLTSLVAVAAFLDELGILAW
jgi:hypothetical protein